MANAIEIQDLIVELSGRRILKGLSLTVQSGEIFGFLGPNGAGKSTTIKTLLGLIPSYKGRVLLQGLPPHEKASRQRVGFLPEEAIYYRFLSPVEHLKFYGRVFGIPSAVLSQRTEKLLKLVGIWEVRNKPISTFSKGMVQKMSIAQSLINDPEILVLDEPTSGLDPITRIDLRKILMDLHAAGKTIFFSSHELSEVELLCHSIAVVKEGRVVRTGATKEILSDSKEPNLERFFIDLIGKER